MGDYITAQPDLIPSSITYSHAPPPYTGYDENTLINQYQNQDKVKQESLLLQRTATSLYLTSSQPISARFSSHRETLAKMWHALEVAGLSLVDFDNTIHAKIGELYPWSDERTATFGRAHKREERIDDHVIAVHHRGGSELSFTSWCIACGAARNGTGGEEYERRHGSH